MPVLYTDLPTIAEVSDHPGQPVVPEGNLGCVDVADLPGGHRVEVNALGGLPQSGEVHVEPA